ncbi:MAG: 50S ribosomal protein L11 [Methanosarcinaceae archaeon]|jgi:large subunit ribosomal protein L11|nr:50S ribosomal protein L11 [Methanosarcinaceae archaeon]NKQ38758.1 50S ribosomal protein L11 [Methanosarcinales archaeon]
MVNIVEALVAGGKATPGPPLGPALGPLGVNIKEIIDGINKKTKDYNGMQVPIKVIIDDKKNFEIEVGTPPTAALILKEIGLKKGSGTAGNEVVGNITLQQIAKIARMKKEDILSDKLKPAMKEIMGTCVTLGLTVEGMDPRECQKSVTDGNFDEIISSEKW